MKLLEFLSLVRLFNGKLLIILSELDTALVEKNYATWLFCLVILALKAESAFDEI